MPAELLGSQRGSGIQGTGSGKGGVCRWQGPAGHQGQAAAGGVAEQGTWSWKLKLYWYLREKMDFPSHPQS